MASFCSKASPLFGLIHLRPLLCPSRVMVLQARCLPHDRARHIVLTPHPFPKPGDLMTAAAPLSIYLVATPGLEAPLAEEARAAGFAGAQIVEGGVSFPGGWPDVWRANLQLRGATRVLARIAEFRAMHLAQLDKRAHKLAWSD